MIWAEMLARDASAAYRPLLAEARARGDVSSAVGDDAAIADLISLQIVDSLTAATERELELAYDDRGMPLP